MKPFKVKKKVSTVDERKSFLLSMDFQKLEVIDKLATKSNYNRNEFINMMLDYALENIE
ncbi:CopG family transcriptional regulator [Clostridium psychrophilum]|nr:CopG family transcriptional regulator [Clostridium psychrophilum]